MPSPVFWEGKTNMKKFIFGILLLALFAYLPICEGGSSVDKAFTDNVRRSDGKITITVREHALDVAMGLIADESESIKFGRNIEIDDTITADVWDGGHTLASGGVSLVWVAPTQARVHQLVSSSASDDGDPGGVGARTVRIYYLKDWDTPELIIDVVMNGTSNVALPSMVMINRMEVLTKGATNVNVGIIKATADTDSTITSQIRVGQGQTQQCILGISSLDDLYLHGMYAYANKAGGAAGLVDISLLYNPEPDTELTNFLTKHTFGLQTVGTSGNFHPFIGKKIFNGPGILKISVFSGTNNMDVSAGWCAIVKVDASKFGAILASNSRRLLDNRILMTSDGRVIRTSQNITP